MITAKEARSITQEGILRNDSSIREDMKKQAVEDFLLHVDKEIRWLAQNGRGYHLTIDSLPLLLTVSEALTLLESYGFTARLTLWGNSISVTW